MGDRTLEEDDALIETLRAIAEADAVLGPAPGVELHLRAAVRAIATARRRRAYGVAVAVAATLLLAIFLPGQRTAPLPSPNRSLPIEVTTEFLPLMYADVPVTEGRIVRFEVPQAALITFGLSTVDTIPSSSGTVLADVVVGEDGLARAVRFVQRRGQEFMP